MKVVNFKNSSVVQSSCRAIADVSLGMKAGRKLSKKNDLPTYTGYKLGLISTYRNLKSSNNLFPAAFSVPFFFVPVAGAQLIGFAIGCKLKNYIKPSMLRKMIK